MAEFVKFDVPKEIAEKQLELVEKIRKKGKIRVGVNEVTKAVERGKAKLVLIARDVSPPEIVMHLPIICAEKDVAFSFVDTRKELGEKAGIAVGTSAIVVLEEGDAKKEIADIGAKLKELAKA